MEATDLATATQKRQWVHQGNGGWLILPGWPTFEEAEAECQRISTEAPYLPGDVVGVGLVGGGYTVYAPYVTIGGWQL